MIAIITARSGSKRIPGKNIRAFCGRPIIAYSIECAIQSKLFDEVMVSTDSDEIATVAMQYGASVPFLRSPENSDDFAGTADVISEVLHEYNKRGRLFDSGCCIYPTAPFVRPITLTKSLDFFRMNDFDVVFPVLRYSYPIQRSLHRSADGMVKMIWPENYAKRSQDFDHVYHDAGQFYWFDSRYLMESRKLFGDNAGGYLIEHLYGHDIDNEDDWKVAEFKYRYLFSDLL